MEMLIIGLGKMGASLSRQALEKGVKVIGLDPRTPSEDLLKAGLVNGKNLKDALNLIGRPRKIFLYVPAGEVVENYVEEFSNSLSPGDIIVDGGNSYWGDSLKRHQRLKNKKIHFVDMGTSGGISGAREGACFMVGGDKEAYEEILPILKRIAAPHAVEYVGGPGCGHLVKLIHNGIEFGMLQSIAEGMALLEKFQRMFPMEIESVFKVYRNGSVIRSWLIDLMAEQYSSIGGDLKKVPAYIEDTGEVNWLIADALHLEVPIPVISQSVMELFRSRDQEKSDYRSVAMMRHGFGGHPFGASPYLKKERLGSRLDPHFPEVNQ